MDLGIAREADRETTATSKLEVHDTSHDSVGSARVTEELGGDDGGHVHTIVCRNHGHGRDGGVLKNVCFNNNQLFGTLGHLEIVEEVNLHVSGERLDANVQETVRAESIRVAGEGGRTITSTGLDVVVHSRGARSGAEGCSLHVVIVAGEVNLVVKRDINITDIFLDDTRSRE